MKKYVIIIIVVVLLVVAFVIYKKRKTSLTNGLAGFRPIYKIAQEIRADWKNVNYGAVPYLEAMFALNDINDNYFMDKGSSIVNYFLANAQTWRGEKAKAIKKELNAMVKSTYKR